MSISTDDIKLGSDLETVKPKARVVSARPHTGIAANVHIGVRKTMDEIREQGRIVYWLRNRFNELPHWLLSTILHVMALIVLSISLTNTEEDKPLRTIMLDLSSNEDIIQEDISSDEFEIDEPEIEDPLDASLEVVGPEEEIDQPEAKAVSVQEDDLLLAESDPAALLENLDKTEHVEVLKPDATGKGLGELLRNGRKSTGSSSLKGRSAGNKQQLLAAFGGSKESEKAVYLGLKWLAENQNKDGSWSSNANSDLRGTPAYTGLALLSFLGAGITDKDSSEFSDNVKRGLEWLVNEQSDKGDFKDNGRGYGQAIATMALCEAYAITKQLHLKKAGALSIKYVNYAQGPDGGWRYSPKVEGDLSVTGWDLMALKSARVSYIPINANTIRNAYSFLDSCYVDNGKNSGFSYMPRRGRTLSMTAEGLLMMQYKGMKRDDPKMKLGAKYLSENIPDRSMNDPYYWYYGTQVLHHYGGDEWENWNDQVRENLVAAQVKSGDLKGSWQFNRSHSIDRLYHTCLAIMTLEVYYRYLPLYRTQAGSNF
jgi:prenyltransferase beta subunit